MTTRAEWETLLDRLAVDELISGYGAAVDDGDWTAYVALFTPDGRADYTSAGGIAGPATEVAEWLDSTMRLFPVRQHLIVNRRITLEPPSAVARADYVNPMRLDDPGTKATAPNFVCGGRYTFGLRHTGTGWRIQEVLVREKWRS
ncbi:nuclear transport factor 2 family protein [Actinacidiphila glaucinigra]|uniref:nuclear transport factor 2 family protein n=1 Tax=Actinacidiphila glaucinigra TaxID=235986 RepID=UPI002DDC861A|nr:nuclear transport factor 2 family protein [Actinacidiphila glaucinigra]WSD64154.1 nuclear transport factor 2 family protein [Actinacidiphila glaucinigra]